MRQLVLAIGLLAGFFISEPMDANARKLQLSDLRREVTLADPQISPDGTQIAMLAGRSDFNHDTIAHQIILVDAMSGGANKLALTLFDIASPIWSPNGDKLAFIAKKSEDEPEQIFTVSRTGARLRKITDAAQGVQYFAWRPDGRAIAYATADSPSVRRGVAKYNTAFEVGDNDYLAIAPPMPVHLWLVASNGGSPRRLTRGSWSLPSASHSLTQPYLDSLILPPLAPTSFFSWSPDAKSIAFSKMPDPYLTHADRSVIEVLDLATGARRKLTSASGMEAGGEYSPDGSKVAYWFPRGGKGEGSADILVASTRGGPSVNATLALDRAPWQARWMPNGDGLLVLAHDGTRERVWLVALDGRARGLDIGDLSASAASISRSGAIAFIGSGPQRPTELYLLTAHAAAPRRLTNFNAYFSIFELGSVKKIEWQNGGFRESGVLTYPAGFVAGKKYPLVLQIHGWPNYASQEAFDTDYPGLTQLFAAHGYLAFEPNYRGSDNAGNAFQTAIVGDSVDGPSKDIMAGIAAVEKLGIVDTSKIAVTGWSYGGQLTAWLIGHFDIWKAAMAGAAPTDLPVDYAISNYNVLGRHFLGPSLWQSKAAYQKYVDQSPISYAWNMKTPTLIMAATGDATVPITHSYELFHALRDRGVPVTFIAYPSSEHFPSDPVMSEDIYRRWVGWLDRYLR